VVSELSSRHGEGSGRAWIRWAGCYAGTRPPHGLREYTRRISESSSSSSPKNLPFDQIHPCELPPITSKESRPDWFSPHSQSSEATALLLQNVEILIEKTARSDIHTDVLPLILNSFESNVPELQVRALLLFLMMERCSADDILLPLTITSLLSHVLLLCLL
jgi:hypothetical protein